MEFSRQEYWIGVSFPPSRDLPDPGIDPVSPMSPVLQADSLPTEPSGKPFILCRVCNHHYFNSAMLFWNGEWMGSKKKKVVTPLCSISTVQVQ